MGKIPTSWGKDGKSPQIEGRSEYPCPASCGCFISPTMAQPDILSWCVYAKGETVCLDYSCQKKNGSNGFDAKNDV